MSRVADRDINSVFEIAQLWKKHSLIEGKSLLWPDETIWTEANLGNFKQFFIDMPDTSERNFAQKFQEQLAKADDNVTRLSCELLLVYFLFPSSVSRAKKVSNIRDVASWKGIPLDDQNPSLRGMSGGVGNPGQIYNTGRPNELTYLARVSVEIMGLDLPDRTVLLEDHLKFRTILEKLAEQHREEFGRPPQLKHILLYLLFPDYYERIASEGHKGRIAEAFEDVLEGQRPEHVDDALKAIRDRLEGFLPRKELDFYWAPLRDCWFAASDGDSLSELQALHIKDRLSSTVLQAPVKLIKRANWPTD